MSSTGTYAPAPAPALERAATGNLFAAAVILLLLIASAIVNAERKDVNGGFDEVAHVSYVAHIQRTGDL